MNLGYFVAPPGLSSLIGSDLQFWLKDVASVKFGFYINVTFTCTLSKVQQKYMNLDLVIFSLYFAFIEKLITLSVCTLDFTGLKFFRNYSKL